MNLRSLLKKEYQLQKISINDGFIQVLTDKKGNSSLKILKTTNSGKPFQASIKSFSLSNVKVFTRSAESEFQSIINVKKGEVSGTFDNSNFVIAIKSNGLIEEVFVQGEKLQPMQRYKIDVAINRADQTYSISKGYYQISNIPMKVMGNIKTGERTFIDLVFSAQNISIKQVDKSFLNGLLGQTGFEPKGGSLSLQSTVKGYVTKTIPAISANFSVSKAKVFDNKKNINYSEIFLKGNVNNGHTQQFQKSLSIRIDTFNLKTGKSNQYGSLIIRNLQNPEIYANIYGILDINDIEKHISISGVSFPQGTIENSLTIKGTLPQKEKDAPGSLKVSGLFALSEFHIQLEKRNLPVLKINGIVTMTDNNTLHFDSLYCQASSSDLKIDGTLWNFRSTTNIPVFSGSVASNKFYMSDFISVDPKTTKSSNTIQFPDSIEVTGNIAIENFYFGNFSPKNIAGYVKYKNRSLHVDNFVLNTFSGSVAGSVLIRQNTGSDIYMRAKAFIRKNNLEDMFYGFGNFGQKVISSEHLNGLISGTIQYNSTWSNTLKIDKESIHAEGNLLLENGELKNYDPLMGLSKFIEVEELKHIRFDNLSTNISIQNRKIILDQTHIASSAISFDGSGIHDFDNKYEYRLQVI